MTTATSTSPRSSPAELSPPSRPGTSAPPFHVRQCRDCGRDMVTQTAYTRDPTLRDRYACYGARGMCRGCYHVAWYHGSPDPVVRRRARRDADTCRSGTCIECHSLMTTRGRHQSDPKRYAGYLKYGGYGMCQPCYCKAKRSGVLPQAPGPLAEATLARLRADVGIAPGQDPGGGR